MPNLFPLGASVSMGAPQNSPFPLDTADYHQAADLLLELGYDCMEVHIRDPKMVDGARLKEHCDAIGIGISSIGTGQAYGAEGLSITAADAQVRREAVRRLKEQLDLGSILQCPVIIGSMRGVVGQQQTWEEVDARMVDSLKTLADYAEKTGTELVIEAIDRFETDYLQTARDVLELIDRVGSGRILVHLDTYHMNLEEQSWREAILSCRGRLGHVHVADNRRYYPGWGLIDFAPILTYLREINYARSLTLECYPYPDSVTCLKRGRQHLKGIMDSINCNAIA